VERFGQFREVWSLDTEFRPADGERVVPVCLCGTEVRSGRTIKVWQDELRTMERCPVGNGDDELVLAYAAQAELGCYSVLGWPYPPHLIDLFAEFRVFSNGLSEQSSELTALRRFNIPCMSDEHKEEMIALIIGQESYNAEEREKILDYCLEDTRNLWALLRALATQRGFDLRRSLLRGEYVSCVAKMESDGIPLDLPLLGRLRAHWGAMKKALIDAVDAEISVYDGGVFKNERWLNYCHLHNIAWPVLPSGKPDLKAETFREMSKMHPVAARVHELRSTLGKFRELGFTVGADGRNRFPLMPFRAKTGRNQPPAKKCIFAPARWIRGLIKPSEGQAISYIDWHAQELGTMAALSHDQAMLAFYAEDDPYLAFARAAGGAPKSATRETHPRERKIYKVAVLAVAYGQGARGLAPRIGASEETARRVIRQHKRVFSEYHRWAKRRILATKLTHRVVASFGWQMAVTRETPIRTLLNWPIQSNASEMLRLACILSAKAGVKVIFVVHDALLIEDSVEKIDEAVIKAREAMRQASEIVLGGVSLGTDAKTVKFPERYMDEDGEDFWNLAMERLAVVEAESATKTDEKREVGREVGNEVGREVGNEVGSDVSDEVGKEVGREVGRDVGDEVGREVGAEGVGGKVGCPACEVGREVGQTHIGNRREELGAGTGESVSSLVIGGVVVDRSVAACSLSGGVGGML
jgi:hypothetical protein